MSFLPPAKTRRRPSPTRGGGGGGHPRRTEGGVRAWTGRGLRRFLAGGGLMVRPRNNRAWWLVTPMLVLVAVSAVVPLMTVVNYSVQDTFGNNRFFWAGVQ